MRSSAIGQLLLLGFVLAIATQPAKGKLYRYVDANGNVYYSDKVPAQNAENERSELNEQGMEISHTAAAPSEEERKKLDEEERLRREEQKRLEEQKFKDDVLLRTFRTEEDLLHARDGKLHAIDAMIQVTRSNIRRMKVKLGEMQQSAAALERQGRPLSENLIKDIESTRQQIKNSYLTIVKRELEKEAIRTKAASDQARFRILRHLPADGTAEQPPQPGLDDTRVTCTDKEGCEEAWKRAEEYIRKHATTRLQMLGNAFIMTAIPTKDGDISLAAVRMPREAEADSAEIYLDLQCSPTPAGIDFCKGAQTQRIREGFKSHLEEKRLF